MSLWLYMLSLMIGYPPYTSPIVFILLQSFTYTPHIDLPKGLLQILISLSSRALWVTEKACNCTFCPLWLYILSLMIGYPPYISPIVFILLQSFTYTPHIDLPKGFLQILISLSSGALWVTKKIACFCPHDFSPCIGFYHALAAPVWGDSGMYV